MGRQPLGCSGGIIPANDFVTNPLFADEFEHGLKEVDIQAPILVNVVQQGQLLVAFQAVIADEVADDRPVLLLTPPLQYWYMRASAGEHPRSVAKWEGRCVRHGADYFSDKNESG